MGLLIEGRWHDQWYESSADGAFQREQAQRRNWVTADGEPGPTGEGGFAAEAGCIDDTATNSKQNVLNRTNIAIPYSTTAPVFSSVRISEIRGSSLSDV